MTRVYAVLREIFGHEIDNTSTKTTKLQGTSKELVSKQSLLHMEVNLSDLQFHDQLAVKTVIKEF